MGPLKPREDPKVLGTDKENVLFEHQDFFWKKLGQDAASNGVSFDSYFFPTAYIDVATIGSLTSMTCGDMYLYKQFDASKQGKKFTNDLHRTLSRKLAYDGLFRVRVSTGFFMIIQGLRIGEYYGNIYQRNATDVEVAGMDSLKSIGVSILYDGKLDERMDVYVQAALLYTTSDGQRRVRIHNLSLAVASELSTVFKHAEVDASVNFWSKQMVKKAMSTSLKSIRDELTSKCAAILIAYRVHCATSSAMGQLILPESFKLLPLYTLSMLKSRAFKGGVIPSDFRVFTMRLFNHIGVPESLAYLYPVGYNISVFNPSLDELNILPDPMRVSAIRFQTQGIYLVGNEAIDFRKRTMHVLVGWTAGSA